MTCDIDEHEAIRNRGCAARNSINRAGDGCAKNWAKRDFLESLQHTNQFLARRSCSDPFHDSSLDVRRTSAGSDWKVWGATPLDWSEALFTTYCIFAIAVVVHVMFHWTWICGVVATRFFHCKPGKDDGSHTLIGVSLLVFLVHLLVIGILATKVGLVNST